MKIKLTVTLVFIFFYTVVFILFHFCFWFYDRIPTDSHNNCVIQFSISYLSFSPPSFSHIIAAVSLRPIVFIYCAGCAMNIFAITFLTISSLHAFTVAEFPCLSPFRFMCMIMHLLLLPCSLYLNISAFDVKFSLCVCWWGGVNLSLHRFEITGKYIARTHTNWK